MLVYFLNHAQRIVLHDSTAQTVIRELPWQLTKTRAEEVCAVLNQALVDGAKHSVCDRTAEINANMAGGEPSTHIDYLGTPSNGGKIYARRDGEINGQHEAVLGGLRPLYLHTDVARELDHAFRTGQNTTAAVTA